MYGKTMCRICRDPCRGNFRHASSSHSHTMSVLSDLQLFTEVLVPGTQARSCYHDVTGREPVDCVSYGQCDHRLMGDGLAPL